MAVLLSVIAAVVVVVVVVVVVSLVCQLIFFVAVAPLLLVSPVAVLVPRGDFLPCVGCVLDLFVFLLRVVPPLEFGVLSPPLH